MQIQELQARVQPIIKALLQGRPVEDSHVEVKSAWIDASQAARRLAGHANAARGDSIIWILGIDEKAQKVLGVDALEMDNWIKAVEKYFDGDAPALAVHTNIHIHDKTVVLLYFETHHAAPFVIKNSKGGYPEFEVPWRSGTRLRAAKREDLLQILLPISRVPDLRILEAELNLAVQQGSYGNFPNSDSRLFYWTVKVNLYITPQTSGRIVFPHRNCSVTFNVSDYFGKYSLPVTFKPIGKSSTIICSASEIIVVGPGSVCLEGTGTTKGYSSNKYQLPKGKADISIEIQSANSNKRIQRRMALRYVEKDVISNFIRGGSQWIR